MGNEVINSIRDFNRSYTAILGVINNHILESEYSLTEARIIYELANSGTLTAREIKEKLQIDEGYISRLIKRFEKDDILRKTQPGKDKRTYMLQLTAKGEKISNLIDQQSDDQIKNLISHLSITEQKYLVALVTQIKVLLSKK